MRGAHTAIAFMEEVAGGEQSRKLTGSQVYVIVQKEILANTLPRRPMKKAPRMRRTIDNQRQVTNDKQKITSNDARHTT